MLNLTDLRNYDAKNRTMLAYDVENLFLRAVTLKAFEGAQRLQLVVENFFKLSFEQAYILLDPEAFRREVEEHLVYKKLSKFFQYGRTIFGLAPLILTWSSLSWAVLEYGNYVSIHQKDQVQILSFLQLWQNGFPSDPLTFFWTGLIDVALLLLFLTLSICALASEYHARNQATKFAQELKTVIDGLMEAVLKEGPSNVTEDVQIRRIVRYIKDAIAESYKDLGVIIDSARDTIINTGNIMQNTFDTQINPLITRFDNNIQSFHTDLQSLQTKVSDISSASQAMVNAANAMSGSAASMATSSGDLASNVQQQTGISQNIDNHLGALNTTEQQMAGIIAQAENAVALEIRKAAEDVKKSAERLESMVAKVETVGKQLTSIKPSDIQRITDSANIFAYQANQAASELQKAAQALNATAKALRPRPWFFGR